ncbi:exported hypothetical protein [Cupriavidus taiwanensis]|uniref:Uncharacterized protein n=1 Tax=Cupriavidus taiwanensis TaxID=164546 RepID=A0A375JBL5_9BURK|nr:exported hypothetical protein [Cupriavidus taiwanensis]
MRDAASAPRRNTRTSARPVTRLDNFRTPPIFRGVSTVAAGAAACPCAAGGSRQFARTQAISE